MTDDNKQNSDEQQPAAPPDEGAPHRCTDDPQVLAIVQRLYVERAHAERERDSHAYTAGSLRRMYADAVAAGWATLGAYRDGEDNPWRYLVESLPPPPAWHPLAFLWDDEPKRDRP